MANLSPQESAALDQFLQMGEGYVLNFIDSTFGTFFGQLGFDIHDSRYCDGGRSKAKKLRSFLKQESDAEVGKAIKALIEHRKSYGAGSIDDSLLGACSAVAYRLSGTGAQLEPLKVVSDRLDLEHMNRQINRIEASINNDPELAIGQAKELLETCCKTILNDRRIRFNETADTLPKLVKLALENMDIIPSELKSNTADVESINKILRSLATLTHGLAEVRRTFGTGHGKDGRAKGLSVRHARLVCDSTAAFVHFLFETHLEEK